jgi:hypothetical protein
VNTLARMGNVAVASKRDSQRPADRVIPSGARDP